jgi:hypothetical protein
MSTSVVTSKQMVDGSLFFVKIIVSGRQWPLQDCLKHPNPILLEVPDQITHPRLKFRPQ